MQRSTLLLAFAGFGLACGAHAAEIYEPGSEDDLRLRQAKFQGASQQYYSAIASLLEIQREGGNDFEAPPEYWEMLARYQLAYGLHDEAEQTYNNVAAAAAEPEDKARAQIRLAQFEYQRGYLDLAREKLLRVRETLPRKLEASWRDLYSRVLMADGRYNEAIEVIDNIEGTVEEEMFLRYNLGVALINDGRLPEGRSALDRVGRSGTDSELSRALRDRANVTLGWHFLQKQLGGSAKPVLMRVRSDGIYANRALLGLGWAELAPEGKRQLRGNALENPLEDQVSPYSSLGVLLRRGYLEDPYDRAGIRGFRRTNLADDVADGLARALVPWVELLSRDPQDPAVQEAWLAVPFALDRLGAHTQAVEYYEKAAANLEEAYKRTLRAVRSIQGGRMVETIMLSESGAESGWEWELRELPDAPETYYLQTLIAEHRFAETLKQYRDVRQITNSLQALRGEIADIDSASRTMDRRPVDIVQLIARARRNWNPEYETLKLGLRPAGGLAAPGTYSGTLPDLKLRMSGLRLSELPQNFSGNYERLGNLDARSKALIEPLEAAARRSAERLRKMSVDELNLQKQRIDKYLVETRFSLARMYDSAIPDEDQDEFEIDADGNPIRTPRLERGEFEIDKDRPIDEQLRQRRPPPTTRAEQEEEAEYEVK